jgi:hypothetical protein
VQSKISESESSTRAVRPPQEIRRRLTCSVRDRVIVLYRRGSVQGHGLGPNALKAIGVYVEHATRLDASKVQDRCVGGGDSVDLRVDQHLVIGPEDRVVQHGLVLACLYAFGAQERLEKG